MTIGATTRYRASTVVGIAVLAVSLSGCSAFGIGEEASPSPSPEPSPSPTFDAGPLCEAAEPLLVAVPREFVGTTEHLRLFTDIIAVAPADLVTELTTLRTHFDLAVDPDDPASQDFVNFPPAVQEAALFVDQELRARCP